MAGPDGEAAVPPAAETSIVTPEIKEACAPFTVLGQEIDLEVNFRERQISGTSTLLIFPLVNDLQEVSIDVRQCDVDVKNILVDGRRTVATYKDPYDLLEIPPQWTMGAAQHHIAKNRMHSLLPERRPDVPIGERDAFMAEGLGCVPADGSLKISLRPEDLVKTDPGTEVKALKRGSMVNPEDREDGCFRITVPFRSKRIRDGLQFVGVEQGDTRYSHVYTRHSREPGVASCLFPCIDDPGQRHLFKVSIKFPRTLGDALEQPLATQQTSNGQANGSRKRKYGEPSPREPQSVLIEEDKLLEMTLVSSGVLTGEQVDPEDERKKIMSFECNNASACDIGFAIGPFEHVELWSEFRTEETDEKLGALAAKIHGYCLPGRAEELRHTCAAITKAADHFCFEFGKYPFESYKACFVDDMVHDTAEAMSLSLCSNRLLYSDKIPGRDTSVTRQLVHSLATQYFGIHIAPSRRTDTWLVVAIQWYMTDLFLKTLCGNNWYRFHLKTLSDKLVKQDVNRPAIHDLGEHLHVGDFEMEFMALKAPLVLFILDQRMSKYPGSTGVGRVISHIVSTANINNTEAKATTLDADEFKKSCAKKTQYKLETFWQQWVRGAGCPRFIIKAKFNKKNLNVDITVIQKQGDPRFNTEPRLLEKDDFWREFQEEIHGVYAGELTRRFAGPCTVRIHEADGTPYEHYLDVREADKNGHMWVIPYNTKYKRLKRKSRKDVGNAPAAIDGKNEALEEDVVYFNMFGDCLQTDNDYKNWGLSDWNQETQTAMDQESYEWIRFDCNFEWLCEMSTDMPAYMYLAQLQQDRDVVAHQDAMLALERQKASGIVSTITVRTLCDRRYYYGIRCMAANDLPRHTLSTLNNVGVAHLVLAYQRFFMLNTGQISENGWEIHTPLPNDFWDQGQYEVQLTMIDAIARCRIDNQGRCPKRARNHLYDLLAFNNNDGNEYTDELWIARLLGALTTSLIPVGHKEDKPYIYTLDPYNPADAEFKGFIEKVLDQIEARRRQDEWEASYQNIYTITALECKTRLMKERVIPTMPTEILQYLQDGNIDLVRIKAFECLVEIGLLTRPHMAKFLLTMMSSDNSPFVRDRQFKAFCDGIAAIALADGKSAAQPAPVVRDALAEDAEDGGLIVETSDAIEAITDARKEKAARKEDINLALKGLREDLKGNEDLKLAMWKAITSPTIGLDEMRRYLDICEAMFEPDDSLLLTLKYPTYWTAAKAPPTMHVNGVGAQKKKCIVTFTQHYRTEPKKKAVVVPEPPPAPAPEEIRPPEPKKIKLQTKTSFSGAPGPARTSLPPLSRAPSISVPQPKPPTDSIAVLPSIRPPVVAATPPPALPQPITLPQTSPYVAKPAPAEKKPKSQKRKEEGEPSNRPKKLAKTDNAVPRRNKIGSVTVKFRKWKSLREDTYRAIKAENAARATAESSIVATPARKPLPGSMNRTSSSPTVTGSNSPHPAPESTPRGPPTGTFKPRKPLPSGGDSARKPLPGASGERKPLPGSAPSHTASAPAPIPKPSGGGVRILSRSSSPHINRAPSPSIRGPSALSRGPSPSVRGPSPSVPTPASRASGTPAPAAPRPKIVFKSKIKKEPAP
ncbi:hypothetical protein GE09DRAFT_1128278 [Coniochaeta sp. 2T2.1]|nr:hypothetical protein GE09DRAFT_1128278 [Coniochaeta sp. 2T2.1]